MNIMHDTRRLSLVSLGMLALAALMPAVTARADRPIPYADSFESYTQGTDLRSTTNSWYSSGVTTAAVVRARTYDFPLRRPIGGAGASNVVESTESVTNRLVHAPNSSTNVWLDLMVLPVRGEQPPNVDSDIQMAFYFNTNGQIVVRHAYYDDSFQTQSTWTVLSHPGMPTDKWARVTVDLNYMGGFFHLGDFVPVNTDRWFRVSVNGSAYLTNYYGWGTLPIDALTITAPERGGEWFLMANAGIGGGKSSIASVEVQGVGFWDDYVVTPQDVFAVTPVRWLVKATSTAGGTVYPGGNLLIPDGTNVTVSIIKNPDAVLGDVVVNGTSIGPTNSYTFTNVTSNQTLHAIFAPTRTPQHKVPLDWMADNSLPANDENGNADGDAALNWEEYVAGTNPQDSNSVFEVTDVYYGAGTNIVTWYGTTNSGVTIPFSMWRSTNDLVQDSWVMVATNAIPRSPTGINTWPDAKPPKGKAFYQPAVIWPY